ncbi:hypothetical protein PENTCL1PPCAC_19686, partial [Pristionchus entomophagus]
STLCCLSTFLVLACSTIRPLQFILQLDHFLLQFDFGRRKNLFFNFYLHTLRDRLVIGRFIIINYYYCS